MTQRVAIAGFGAIGKVVAQHLDRGIEGLELAAVSARDTARAEAAMTGITRKVPVVPLSRLGEHAEIVVECAPAAVLRDILEPALALGRSVIVLSCGALLENPDLIDLARRQGGRILVPTGALLALDAVQAAAVGDIAEPALAAGRMLVVMSCGALLDNFDLVDLARRQGGRILVPTGALLGLDAVQATAVGAISRVHMITRKPPNGLEGAPYLVENGISVLGIWKPRCVFTGTAREAARGFPANVNVAAALALAGIGPDRTTIEIWADPDVTRNTHRIELEADSVRLSMQIENVPSVENPRTGRLTPLSVIALLRKLSNPLAIGT